MLRKILVLAVIAGAALTTVPLHAAAVQANDRSVVALECERPWEERCSPDWPLW
ncbi:hypothetical protein Lfu02_01940 [Longispora fulva]|uniref:Uncharacterized protein n=1 Tax=Longispora fulva TaxID=619741 RepID=A0A8J7KI94_9ACTN|nr:hypothetical protein [Longispora fulva]MBG6135934.1 hypothetical protein [Longispora fulva]GIG55822.1 hypothetical protein Lfu02_01940 [Longispora fulva]